MIYLNWSALRTFKWLNIRINNIYPFYRSWWVKTADWKFIWRTFKYSADARLMEQKWNANERKFELVPFDDIKVDRDFFKTYKKVFDIEIETEKNISVENYKWTQEWNTFVIQGVSAFKIKEMLKATVIDDVPEVDGKEMFDWEDNEYKKLTNVTLKFSVVWTWLDTSYNFKPISKFTSMNEVSDIDMNDLPF